MAGPKAIAAAVAAAMPPAVAMPAGPIACKASVTKLTGAVICWSVEAKPDKALSAPPSQRGKFCSAADKALIPAMPTTVFPPKSKALATSASLPPKPPSFLSSFPSVFMYSFTLRVASFRPPFAVPTAMSPASLSTRPMAFSSFFYFLLGFVLRCKNF